MNRVASVCNEQFKGAISINVRRKENKNVVKLHNESDLPLNGNVDEDNFQFCNSLFTLHRTS